MSLPGSFQNSLFELPNPISVLNGNNYSVDLGSSNVLNVLKDPLSEMKAAVETWKGNLAVIPNILREITYPTPFAISPLLPFLLVSLARQKHTPDPKTSFKPEYDYIIVGAGAAGSVIANRLSEEQCVTVLLLEAGKTPPQLSEIPFISPLFSGTDIDWKYKTEPQQNAAFGHNNQAVGYANGKALGGSTVTNHLVMNRANPKNFEKWAENGAAGWNWKAVLPYFLKAENNMDPDIASNGYHNVSGPMSIKRLGIDPVLKDVSRLAAENLGYRFGDSSGQGQIGMSDFQGNVRDNQRCSTAKAYLVPAENRTNLDIVAEAFVTKILIEDNRATGVLVDFKGRLHEVKARKEVIVSAGAFNTPKLLMLSGIGPRNTLKKFGISVKADLPVGANLQDHVATIVNFDVNSLKVPRSSLQLLNPLTTLEYIHHRTGTLAESFGFFSISFFTKNESKNLQAEPDIQLYFLKGIQEAPGISPQFNLKPLVAAKLYGPSLLKTMFFCIAGALHHRSQGYVTIRSTNPYDQPVINPNYFADPNDLDDVVSAIKMCIKLAKTPAMKKFDTRLYEVLMPGCEIFSLLKDENRYWKCYAQHYTLSQGHECGTAKMGDSSDSSTVVDPKLRVKGIASLRVADASIIPSIPTGNPNYLVIMIGEKAADMIKETFQCKQSP